MKKCMMRETREIVCPSCFNTMGAGARFCTECGSRLYRTPSDKLLSTGPNLTGPVKYQDHDALLSNKHQDTLLSMGPVKVKYQDHDALLFKGSVQHQDFLSTGPVKQGGKPLPKDIILKDITNSVEWPVSEKLCKVLFVSPLPSYLECEICLDVLSEPLQTSCCGQSYCKECISKLKKKVCPHCRENLEVFPDKKSIRFINELKIKCPYHIENKCHWKGFSSELESHLKNCEVKPVFCSLGCGMQFEKKNEKIHSEYLCSLRKIPCRYCQKQIMEKDMTKHHEVCPKMLLPCANKCSGKEITRESMKQHIAVCPEQVVACKYREFGCVEGIKRKDHDQHLSSAMEQHLYLVAECAKNERDARKVLEKKIEENTAAREMLEHRIAKLESEW